MVLVKTYQRSNYSLRKNKDPTIYCGVFLCPNLIVKSLQRHSESDWAGLAQQHFFHHLCPRILHLLIFLNNILTEYIW
jgi:hypothetical protein